MSDKEDMIRFPAQELRRGPSPARGKLSGTRRSVNFAAAALLLAMSACITPGRKVAELPPDDWTLRHGDLRHAAHIDERVPTRVRVAWNENMGRGLPSTPVVQQDLILSVVSGGGLITASTANGERYWGRRFNGSIAGQVLRIGGTVLFVTQHRNSTVYALDARTGKRLWSRRLNARAVAEPAYADSMIYIVTDRGDVHAIGIATGAISWNARVAAQPVQPPLILGDALILASRDTLVHVALDGGAVRARHPIAAVPTAPLAARGDTITIAMQGGIISAYAERGAREVWRHVLDATVLAAPVVADDAVYVLTRNVDLYRLEPYRAERIADLDGAATESLTVTATGALIGRLDGRIALIGFDGAQIWEEQLNGSIRAPAAVSNASVYVSTLTGRMAKLTQ
jgi:outer membrane protein assembly factor BamB